MEPTMIKAQTTKTLREMTTDDLQVGDTWVYTNQKKTHNWFYLMIGESRFIKVKPGDPIKRFDRAERSVITLVDVKFEAERKDSLEFKPLFDVELGKDCEVEARPCKPVKRLDFGFIEVQWLVQESQHKSLLPSTIQSVVRKPATYDSWDDVSVGDVFAREGNVACVKLGRTTWLEGNTGTIREACKQPVLGRELSPTHTRPARLTSVTWTPKTEITR